MKFIRYFVVFYFKSNFVLHLLHVSHRLNIYSRMSFPFFVQDYWNKRYFSHSVLSSKIPIQSCNSFRFVSLYQDEGFYGK